MRESRGGMSSGNFFCTALLLVFITLKLCGVIDWSWWWVMAPLWIPAAIAVVLLVVLWLTKPKKSPAEIALD